MAPTDRLNYIDIAKGIGIILVVIGHTKTHLGIEKFIYQFHMPLFFMLSGFMYKESYDQQPLKFLKRRIERLYFPFVQYGIILLFAYCLISYLVKGYTGYSFLGFGYASVRIILGLSSAPLGGVLWFLRSLLTVSILFSLLRLLIKNIKYKNIIAGTLILVITTIGYFTQLPYNISSSFVALLFYYSGYLFSQNISYLKLNYWGAFLSFGIVLFATLINQVDLAFNEYRYFFLFVLSSFAGTYLVLFVSLKIQHHGLLEKIGQRSLVIMGFHFFAFVLVNYLIQTIYSLPVEKIMDFPTIKEYRYWWIIYSIIGVSVPFGVIDSTINVITQRMKTIIPEKYSIIVLFNKLNLF